jgi:uncharacterized OB-fold protein
MTFGEKQTNPEPEVGLGWRGDMQADYLYPNGAAGDKFFKHIKENDTFLAGTCPKCNITYLPPRIYCEDCYEEINEFKEVPAAGTVRLFTVAYLNAEGEKLEKPQIMALVDIDGTNGAWLAKLRTDDISKDYTGAKVKAIFRPKDSREGTMKDILYFE